jgi:hypothetical protein
MCTHSGNFISTWSSGLVFMNSTRSSPACSIMRTCRSFLFDHRSVVAVYPSIIRVKKGCELSLLFREMKYTTHAAGIVAMVSQKPLCVPLGQPCPYHILHMYPDIPP